MSPKRLLLVSMLSLSACANGAIDGMSVDASVQTDSAAQRTDANVVADASTSDATHADAAIVETVFTRYPSDEVRSPITPSVVASMRALVSEEHWDDVFMKVGDSNTVNTNFLACLASDSSTTLDSYATELSETVTHFRAGSAGGSNPYSRVSLAARVGESADWPFAGDPTPFSQEYEALLPQFAFVAFGTNDMESGADAPAALPTFFDNLNALIDAITAQRVIPIITGLPPRDDNADDRRWVPTFDAITRAVAEARQLPYISWYNATHELPDAGLVGDGLHGNAYSGGACNFSSAGLQFGFNQRNLLSMQTLNSVWRTVSLNEAAPDEVPAALEGEGTQANPFVIDHLPFTHFANTALSTESRIDDYPVCSTGQNESGPEIYYTLALPSSTRMRFVVMDLGDADVDVHVIASSGTCRERGHRYAEGTFAAGDYTVVVDSFVDSGSIVHSGEYAFVAIECEAGDTRCD